MLSKKRKRESTKPKYITPKVYKQKDTHVWSFCMLLELPTESALGKEFAWRSRMGILCEHERQEDEKRRRSLVKWTDYPHWNIVCSLEIDTYTLFERSTRRNPHYAMLTDFYSRSATDPSFRDMVETFGTNNEKQVLLHSNLGAQCLKWALVHLLQAQAMYSGDHISVHPVGGHFDVACNDDVLLTRYYNKLGFQIVDEPKAAKTGTMFTLAKTDQLDIRSLENRMDSCGYQMAARIADVIKCAESLEAVRPSLE